MFNTSTLLLVCGLLHPASDEDTQDFWIGKIISVLQKRLNIHWWNFATDSIGTVPLVPWSAQQPFAPVDIEPQVCVIILNFRGVCVHYFSTSTCGHATCMILAQQKFHSLTL
jgi:hypothetical protein